MDQLAHKNNHSDHYYEMFTLNAEFSKEGFEINSPYNLRSKILFRQLVNS